MRLALFDTAGQVLELPGEDGIHRAESLIELDRPELRLILKQLPKGPRPPVPSVLRMFSAPVILEDDLDDTERLLLLAHDSDPFNRWEAGQRLGGAAILDRERILREGGVVQGLDGYGHALGRVLADDGLDPMMKAAFLNLPGFESLSGRCVPLDPLTLFEARRQVVRELATRLRDPLWVEYCLAPTEPRRFDFAEHGRCTLRNSCLGWLSRPAEPELLDPAAVSITGRQHDGPPGGSDHRGRAGRLGGDHHDLSRYHEHAEVVDAWLGVIACSSAPGA